MEPQDPWVPMEPEAEEPLDAPDYYELTRQEGWVPQPEEGGGEDPVPIGPPIE